MRRNLSRSTVMVAFVIIGAVFCVAAIRMSGQATGRRTERPRLQQGHPNLNGIWQATTTANWDLLAHTMRPAVGQPGVYPDVQVLAAPVLALGSVGCVPPGPGVVEGNVLPYKPEAAAKKKENAEQWL